MTDAAATSNSPRYDRVKFLQAFETHFGKDRRFGM
jgi:hypothetical protein